ncbi:hypothetical protein H7F31_16870 [Paenibacillus sp. PAMC21692]|nr:hypothetical protein H7F31_16870 [Paenibacillus sp. PAMC21692]
MSAGMEKRQVFDLPFPRMETTEFRAEKRYCAHCQRMQRAAFPARVTAPVQYGSGLAAWTVYLHAYHMLPLDRIAQLVKDLTTYRPRGNLAFLFRDRFRCAGPCRANDRGTFTETSQGACG